MFQGWTSGGTDYGACVGHANFWVNTLASGDHMVCRAEYTVPNAAAGLDKNLNEQTLMETGVFFPIAKPP